MNFKICVAIQIKTGDFNENRILINKALSSKPDLIELRLDYIDNYEDLSEVFIKKFLELIQPEIPVILTLRDSSEGGHMDIDKNLRFNLIRMLINVKPAFLDIEMNTELQFLEEIIPLALQNKVQLIFSYHDFKKTPKYEEAIKIFEDFMNKTDLPKSSIIKAIFTAQTFEDNLVPLEICSHLSEKHFKNICFCMGDIGIFSRITCVKAGSFLTFGSIEDITAPGQIGIEKIRELHQLLFY